MTTFFKTLRLFLFSLIFLFCTLELTPAYAADSAVLAIQVEAYGQNVTALELEFSALGSMPNTKQEFSTVDNSGAVSVVVARGVLISDLLNLANINASDVQSVTFYSKDGTQRTFDYNLLNSERYFYKDTFSSNGAGQKTRVYPMLALETFEQTDNQSADFDKPSNQDGICLLLGQSDSAEKTKSGFIKNINKINIKLKDGGAFVALDPSVNNQYFKPGSVVSLKGFVTGLSSATISLISPNGITLISREIDNIPSGAFFYPVPIIESAPEGAYTISVSSADASKKYTAQFNVYISKTGAPAVASVSASTTQRGASPSGSVSSSEGQAPISTSDTTDWVNGALPDTSQAQENQAGASADTPETQRMQEIEIQDGGNSVEKAQTAGKKVFEVSQGQTDASYGTAQNNIPVPFAAFMAIILFLAGIGTGFKKYKSEV